MGNNAQLAGFCLGIQLHTGQRQDMGLDLRAVRAQGINAARAVALGNGAWTMAHDLRDGPGRCPGGLAQQRKRTAQPVERQVPNSGALQRLGMACTGVGSNSSTASSTILYARALSFIGQQRARHQGTGAAG